MRGRGLVISKRMIHEVAVTTLFSRHHVPSGGEGGVCAGGQFGEGGQCAGYWGVYMTSCPGHAGCG